MLRVLSLVLLLTISAFSWAQSKSSPVTFASKKIAELTRHLPASPSAATVAPGNGIVYYGGSIMDDANGVNVYFIWYGDWSHDRLAQSVLTNFITHVGGSPYFNINTTYYSLEPGPRGNGLIKDRVINAVHYLGAVDDHYSQSATLTDYGVYASVANAISSGALPADPNAVYFVLTSSDVVEPSGFISSYCGWHDSTLDAGLPLVNGVDIKFAFVGDPVTQGAYDCIWNFQTTMSGSLAADGMASVIAHELEESTTDPDITSWYTADGTAENADLCAWTFGGAYHSGYATDPNPPNMRFKGVPYLIQQNWVNAKGGYCALRWDE